MGGKLPKDANLGALSEELKAINRTSMADMKRALELLNTEATPAPTTRQQRRKAERQAQKRDR